MTEFTTEVVRDFALGWLRRNPVDSKGRPTAGSNHMMNLYWCCLTNRMAMEAIAENLGISLETLAAPDPAERTPITTALAYLVQSMRDFPAPDEKTAYEARAGFRLAATCNVSTRSAGRSSRTT